MATEYDLIKDIVESGLSGNKDELCKSLNDLVSYSYKKKHAKFASELQRIISNYKLSNYKHNDDFNRYVMRDEQFMKMLNKKTFTNLTSIVSEYCNSDYKIDDMVMNPDLRNTMLHIIDEHRQYDRLKAIGLPINHRFMFRANRGNGKTLACYVLAGELDYPIVTIDLYEFMEADWNREVIDKLEEIYNDLVNGCRRVIVFDNGSLLDNYNNEIKNNNGSSYMQKKFQYIISFVRRVLKVFNDKSLIIFNIAFNSSFSSTIKSLIDEIIIMNAPSEAEIIELIEKTFKDKAVFDFKAQNFFLDNLKRYDYCYGKTKKTLTTAFKLALLDDEKIDSESTQYDITTDIIKDAIKIVCTDF